MTAWLEWAGLASVGVGAAVATRTVLLDPQSPPARAFCGYVVALEARALGLRLSVSARGLASGQVGALVLIAGLAVGLDLPFAWLLVVPAGLGPGLVLDWLRRRRTAWLERQLAGFCLTLANSLQVTPNLAAALAALPVVLAPPLQEEVALVCGEVRLGATLDDALRGLCRRAGSRSLDAAVAALLIGRRVGGDLPRILGTTAATLRELERLDGVVQARTSEARAQLWVLALCPFGFVAALAAVSPGYFQPLQTSALGGAVALGAGLLWLGALVVARHVLSVTT